MDASMMVEVWRAKRKGVELRLVIQATMPAADPNVRLEALNMVCVIEELLKACDIGEDIGEAINETVQRR